MRKYTVLVMALSLFALLLVEVPALLNDEIGDTISEIMWGIAKDYPIVVLFIGILLGHFFWPLRKDSRK